MLKNIFLGLLISIHLPTHALTVLRYQHIAESDPTGISPEIFASHMDYLEKHNFRVLSILQLQELVKRGEAIPDLAVVITFDGAWKTVLTHAIPELYKRKWPYTLFIQTKAQDEKNPRVMAWDELKKLSKQGATIANMTDSHPHLIRQQHYESFSQWQRRRENEIDFAEKRIHSMIGSSHRLFAYPYGEYDSRLLDRLREQGYLAFGLQAGPISATSHPQILPRFALSQKNADAENFILRVASLSFPQSRISVTANDGKVLKEPELPDQLKRPILRITSPIMPFARNLSCYLTDSRNNDQALKTEVNGSILIASAITDLSAGRNYYTCMASAGGGRYFWHSELFIRRHPNGTWTNE